MRLCVCALACEQACMRLCVRARNSLRARVYAHSHFESPCAVVTERVSRTTWIRALGVHGLDRGRSCVEVLTRSQPPPSSRTTT